MITHGGIFMNEDLLLSINHKIIKSLRRVIIEKDLLLYEKE